MMTRSERSLRDWLTYVIETAIDMLDALDAAGEDLEDADFEEELVA
jgi:hypothetical protein